MFKDHYGATIPYDEEHKKSILEHLSPYVSELAGTFLLVFTARVLSVPAIGNPVWNPTAIGFMLTVLIYIFGSVRVDGPATGAHLNPAISFAAGVTQKEKWRKVFVYIILQIAGGLLGGGLCAQVFPGHVSTAVGPQQAFENTYCAGLIEVVYTAILAFVALSVVSSRRNNPQDDQNHFFALAIGFVVIAGGYAGGNISGGCFNPAMALGLDTTPFWVPRAWTLAYVGFEMLGGFIGACLFLICRREDSPSRERLSDVDLQTYEPPVPALLFSEFLGTFVLVLTVGLCVVLKCEATAWAAAAALMCMIYALGDVSGAHFNPAVTLAVMLSRRGKCPPHRALHYMLVQCVAGLTASFLIADIHVKGPYSADQFCLKPASQVNKKTGMTEDYWSTIFWAEFSFTFMLAFVVLAVATTKPDPVVSKFTRQNFNFGLTIASCVTAGGFAAGSLSGGELNPAVSIGLQTSCALAPGSVPAMPYSYVFYFVFFELAGGIFAATIFVITHHHEFIRAHPA